MGEGRLMGKLSLKDIKSRRALTLAIVEPIVVGMRDRKVAGTYKRMTPGPDGVIHTALSPDTASNRLSSSESSIFEHSTNLQNQEKKVAKLDVLYRTRDVIVPKTGMVLLAGDYVNAEALLVAAYSRDYTWLDEILSGVDTHLKHIVHFWGVASEDPMEREIQRDISKTITYASLYYAKLRTIVQNMNKESDRLGRYFTEEEVRPLYGKFLQLHPLERWWTEVREELAKSGAVMRNCFGYRRTFYAPDADSRLKDALSFLPQSTVAWLMNGALPKMYVEIDKPGRRELLHQIHDENLWQCCEDEIPTIITRATPILERRFRVHTRELYIPVEWKSGPDWGHLKTIK